MPATAARPPCRRRHGRACVLTDVVADVAHQIHARYLRGNLPQQVCARGGQGRQRQRGLQLGMRSSRCSTQADAEHRWHSTAQGGRGRVLRGWGWQRTNQMAKAEGGRSKGRGAQAARGALPAAPACRLALSSSSAGELSSSRTPGSESVMHRTPASRRATAAAGDTAAAAPGSFGTAAAAAAAAAPPAAEVDGCVGSKWGGRCEAPGSSGLRPARGGSMRAGRPSGTTLPSQHDTPGAQGSARPGCNQQALARPGMKEQWASCKHHQDTIWGAHPGCPAADRGCTALPPALRFQ